MIAATTISVGLGACAVVMLVNLAEFLIVTTRKEDQVDD